MKGGTLFSLIQYFPSRSYNFGSIFIEWINKFSFIEICDAEAQDAWAQEAWGRVIWDKAVQVRKDRELVLYVFILSKGDGR